MPTLRMMSSLRGAERAQHVLQLRLDGREPGGDVDDDREERDQEGGEDRRNFADAEPQTRIGTTATLGIELKPIITG